MRGLLRCAFAGALGLAWLLGTAGTSRAAMVLTAAGTAEGFTLSTFADQFPNQGPGGVGPVGITFTNSGGVMVSSYANGKVAVFASDTDGQHYTTNATISSTTYGNNDPTGLTRTSDGHIYMARQQQGTLVEVDQSGNFIRTVIGSMPAATGVATNPNNNHIFVSTLGNNAIWDVDTVANTKTLFVNASADGLTADATNLYGEVNGHILGWHISNGLQFFDSGFISGADGAVLGQGTLAGKLYVNTNDGRIVEVKLSNNAQTVIATGGSRGDLVSVDPNGSLLLTQTDSVLRLTAPAGGSFGVPEPGTLTLAGIGLVGLVGARYRRRRARAA